MIRGLINEQQIGLGEQKAGQVGASALPSRKLANRRAPRFEIERQPCQDFPGFGLEPNPPALLEGVQEGRITAGPLAVIQPGFQSSDLGMEACQSGIRSQDVVLQLRVFGRNALLVKVRHMEAATPHRCAGLRLEFSLQDAEEGGLARTVGANESDAVTGIDIKGDPLEKGISLSRVTKGKIGNAE
jgi:hypothetical protein